MSRLRKRLLGLLARASHDFRLIEPGDKIMAAVSGGKDSLTMLYLLEQTRRRAPFDFSLIAVCLDEGQPGFPARQLGDYLEAEGYEYRMVREDTYAIVKDKLAPEQPACSLCSRLRRGVLYNLAAKLEATKIALGHHRDDMIETLLLNLLFSGQIKAMAPRLRSDDGRNVVIRPLAYCQEADLAAFAREMAFPVLTCKVCGSQQNPQRQRIKQMIGQLRGENDNIPGSLFAALGAVRPGHLLDLELRRQMGIDEATDDGLQPGALAPSD
jgi:tRNA 2-thiocytidine biosynthesis protein TtcA